MKEPVFIGETQRCQALTTDGLQCRHLADFGTGLDSGFMVVLCQIHRRRMGKGKRVTWKGELLLLKGWTFDEILRQVRP